MTHIKYIVLNSIGGKTGVSRGLIYSSVYALDNQNVIPQQYIVYSSSPAVEEHLTWPQNPQQ